MIVRNKLLTDIIIPWKYKIFKKIAKNPVKKSKFSSQQIFVNKRVNMNRKERRDLKKDKNLITELFSIINKYFSDLLDKFSNLTDVRNKSYVTYNMKTIVYSYF